MVEIKIGDKKFLFYLSMVNLVSLNSKYNNNLKDFIDSAVLKNDSDSLIKLMRDIIKASFVGSDSDRNLFDGSYYKDIILDHLAFHSDDATKFIGNIMPDKRYMVWTLDIERPDMPTTFNCCCTPRSSGRYPGIYFDGRLIDKPVYKKGAYTSIIDKWMKNNNSDKTNKEEIVMPYRTNNVQITKIVTHNNMVTIVYFSDGSFTKAICSKNDTYDLDVGIQVCIMKKMLGEKRYFKTMEYAHKLIEKQEQDKKDAIELKRQRRAEQKKREEKNKLARKKAVDQWKNDITDAVKAAISNKEDDLK